MAMPCSMPMAKAPGHCHGSGPKLMAREGSGYRVWEVGYLRGMGYRVLGIGWVFANYAILYFTFLYFTLLIYLLKGLPLRRGG